RHTRSYGDWSSDVCSSDLQLIHSFYLVEGKIGIHSVEHRGNALGHAGGIAKGAHRQARLRPGGLPEGDVDFRESLASDSAVVNRSEERRVGKECRCRVWVV